MFSCVVPVKGARPFFDEAIESLRGQGFGDDLEIIVQDGDAEPDAGQSDALNKGFAKAKGEWFFWLNADDVLLPGALEKVRCSIAHGEQSECVEWIAGDTVYMDANGIVQSVRSDARWRPWFGSRLSVWTGGPSAFFRRKLWDRMGGLDATLKYVMDIDLWTRWARTGKKFVGISDYLWGFRVHADSATMGGRHDAEHLMEKQSLLVRYGISRSVFWCNLSRAVSVLDGSWFRRKHDSRFFHGMHWSEIVR